MRKSYKSLIFVIAALFITISAGAQDVKQNVIKVNLMSPLVRTGSFFYERALNEDMSLQMGFFYSGASVGDTKFRGFGITPEFRYYLSESKVAPAGIYIAPYLRYQSFDLSSEGEVGTATYSATGGGLLLGVQRLLKNVVTIEAFAGPSYSKGNIKLEGTEENIFDTEFFDGFSVRFGFTVGLAL